MNDVTPTTPRGPRHLARAALPFVVSVVAIAGVAWWASQQRAPTIPTSPDALALLAAAIGMYGVITALRGFRFHEILVQASLPHRRRDAYGLTVVSYMGNAVLPARGGEVLRILLLADRANLRRRDVLGAVVPERLLDAATLALLFTLLTISGRAADELGHTPTIVAGAGLLAGIAGLLLYWRLRIAGRFESLADRIRPLTRATRQLLGWRGFVLASLTIAVWFLEASVFWLVTTALDLDVGAVGAAFAVVAASFLALVPAGPGYVGTFDAAILFALGVLDVTGGEAVSVLLLYRFVIFVPVTIAGLVLVVTRYGGLRSLGRGRSGAADDEELLAEELPGERGGEVPLGERAGRR